MSELKHLLARLEAKKKSGYSDVVYWKSVKSEERLLRNMADALEDADIPRNAFFKEVVITGLPVYDGLPPEGKLCFEWCKRYMLSENKQAWLPIAKPESIDSDTTDTSNQGQGNENTTSITDSGDTASAASSDAGTTTAADTDSAADTAGSADTETDASTESPGTETVDGEELPSYAYNVNGELMADVEKESLQPVVRLNERHRVLSQFILEDRFSHHITPEQLAEVSYLDLDTDDAYIQDMLLAYQKAPDLQKLDALNLWEYTDSFKKIFSCDKRYPLSLMINFNQEYADAHPIDRGLLVQEWIKGNYISRVEKSGTTSASAAPEPQKTSSTKADVAVSGRTATKTTYKAIDIRIGRALAKGAVTYPITARDVEQGKAIVEADGEEFKRWSATYRITENIQLYDEKTHIEMIRQAPREVVTGSPELRRAYVDNYLAAYGTLDPDQMVFMSKRAPVGHEENLERVRKAGKNLRDMAAGRFKCDEENPQSTSEDVLADKPPAPETVEPDANEHHPDTRSMATESSVTADSEKTSREQFSEQLAADRGDFVPGISDPDDPRWVHNDYSASSEGEKTEVGADDVADAADSADHSEEFSGQLESETSHSEPVADQLEPETPETEPKSQKPEPVTKAEITPLNNDDRTTEQAADSNQDSEPDRSLAPEPEPGTMLEILLLLRKVARDLRHIVDINQQILDSNQLTLASNLNIEKSHRKAAAAIGSALAMTYATKTEEETTHGE